MEKLISFLPLWILKRMLNNKRKINSKEKAAQRHFMDKLVVKSKSGGRKPIVVAMIGLVGSGKSYVAQKIAGLIDATVIEADQIRLELKSRGSSYDKAWAIAENIALEIAEQDGNVVLDSDFVDAKKRASLREKLREDVQIFFVRTTCDIDVMAQRIRQNDPGEFFNGASTASLTEGRGKDVKFREMMRRLPNHYVWKNYNETGGLWKLRRFPFVSLTIDTTYDTWKNEVEEYTKRLMK